MSQNENLAYRLKYRVADLDANRDGYMTREQRQALRRLFLKRISISLAVIVTIIMGCLLFYSNIQQGDWGSPVVIFGVAVAVVMWCGRWIIVNWQRLKADLRKGSTQMVEGEIETSVDNNRKTGYFSIDGLKFNMPASQLELLRDGYYRVYFAPHTGQLLTVELLKQHNIYSENMNTNLTVHNYGFDPVLASIFDFTREDLEVNRRCVMTDQQMPVTRGKVIWRTLKESFSTLLLWSAGFAPFVAILLAGERSLIEWVLVFAGGGMLLLSIIGRTIYSLRQLQLDLRERRVRLIRGRTYLPKTQTDSLTIDGAYFKIPYSDSFPLRIGAVYCAYYTPRTRHILAIERVAQ